MLIVTQFLSQKMTPQPGRGSVAAEDDDVHAADVRLYVLLRCRPGWYYTGLTSNVVGIAQQLMLNRVAARLPAAVVDVKPVAQEEELGIRSTRWPKRSIRLPRQGPALSNS